ncbi:minor structural protein [Caldibacillus phage CBP1]|uniref:Putative phage tail component, N-terminal domain n=1 Tax=Caldibacillus debilis GB1 TaxID=1339248 RepID=A0A420VIR1_9BACI|nr:distal tail protein Dit [Caldibacillus debilis]ATB52741.1 minor structural protein [Caldibacillus phage CBP1]RKO63564.1 putative phage tail component, N-terminal domain [Caldibacillus debilis GB1]
MTESDVYLDGRNIKEFGLFLRQNHEHPIPETRDQTIEIPGVHGLRHMGSTLGPRQFNLPLGIVPQIDRWELQRKIREFTRFLLDDYGRPRNMRLIFGYEPDKYYMVRYNGSISPERLVTMGVFELPLIAYDPFAYFLYSTKEITWDTDIPILSDISWLNGITEFEVKGNQTVEIINEGHVIVRPTFLIEGSANSLTLSMNGKSFSLPSFSNVTYEINGENYTVFKNGVNNFSDKIGKDWLELLPGINQLTVTGTGLNIHLTVDYRFKFV